MEHLISEIFGACFHYWWIIAVAIVVLQLIKPPNGVEQAINEFNPKNTHGGAAWVKDDKSIRKAGLLTGEGIPIGYAPSGREIHYAGPSHVAVIAKARSGKGLLAIAALLSVRRGMVVIDPKSENALVTYAERRRMGPVYILSPFKDYADELGSMFARYNPMNDGILDTASLSFHSDCDRLAASLVWEEGREHKFFSDGARILVSGIIAALKRHAPKDRQNLVEVAGIIGSGSGLFAFCRETIAGTKDRFIKAKLERFALSDDADPSKGLMDVIGTAISNLGFLNNAAIAESLSGSDFRFCQVRQQRATVFICLPLSQLGVSDKYFRLIMENALAEFLNEGRGK
jgi:type IV secretion system protein VirD4